MAFDINSPADLTALKNEVELDPEGIGYGYDPLTTPTAEVVNKLNEKRAAYPITKPSVGQDEVRAACTYDAYNNLSIDEQEWLRWMTQNGDEIKITTDLRLNLADPDGDGTNSIWAVADRVAMNAAMIALMDVDGSRAQALFGYDTNISRQHFLTAWELG